MKKILLLCSTVIIMASCNNKKELFALQLKNDALITQINNLKYENDELKKQLDYCKYGNPEENIVKVGRWLDSRPNANIQLTLKQNTKTGKYFLESKFDDGSIMKEQVQVSISKGLKKIQSMENQHLEWFIIEKDGNLSMWSQNGKFGTALCF